MTLLAIFIVVAIMACIIAFGCLIQGNDYSEEED